GRGPARARARRDAARRPGGGRMSGPPPASTRADLGRPRSRGAARLDPGRLRARYAQLLAPAAGVRAGGGPDLVLDAADNAYLPSIVERERLLEANSTIAAST